MSTVHAGSPAEALRRIEVLALMSDVGLPHAAIREQIADAFDLVVCQARLPDGDAPRRQRRRGRPRRRRPGGAGAVRLAGRRPALASGDDGRARRTIGRGGAAAAWARPAMALPRACPRPTTPAPCRARAMTALASRVVSPGLRSGDPLG